MKISQAQDPFSFNRKPQIDYPCQWQYKVIGKDPELIKAAILSSCTPIPVRISHSHSSSRGSYLSYNADVRVENEAMRLSIYQSLCSHPAIKLVL